MYSLMSGSGPVYGENNGTYNNMWVNDIGL